ncbi:unnamed protein product [Rhizophagus irregularis]|nr:unnamed protein product [Rhizophagus irregularis]CAB5358018.1 unnamed protein product [Rhizophagus irregularis]
MDQVEKRNAIRFVAGEANSAPLETFLEEWRKLQDYTLNIFNANEAELFFRMASNQTLASAPTSGTKLDRTRITVLLATNAIGTQISNHLPGCEVIFLSAFLSPNTTAHGCRHYGGSMLPLAYMLAHVSSKVLRQFINNITYDILLKQINKINVNAQAWNLVKAEPIVNCWRKTGISPTVNENGDDSIHYPTSSNCTGNGKSRESRGH